MMNAATPLPSDPAARYQQARIGHWDNIARRSETWHGWGGYYHRRLAEVYRFWVAPGQRVLELGCAQGDLLAALQPSNGVGIDFSAEMIHRARQRHPALRFIQADAHDFELDETFDVIILSDLLNDAWDVQTYSGTSGTGVCAAHPVAHQLRTAACGNRRWVWPSA